MKNKKIKSRYRPDILIKGEDNIIIIEVDENQHKAYKIDKELSRENEIRSLIKQELSIAVIFIRFNPAVFYDWDNKIILYPLIARFRLLESILVQNKDLKEDKRIMVCFDRSEEGGYIS